MSLLSGALKLTTKAAGRVLGALPRAAVTVGAGVIAYDTLLPVAEGVTGRDLPGDGTITTRVAQRVGEVAGTSYGGATTGATLGVAQGGLGALGFDTASPQTQTMLRLGVLGLAGLFVLQAVRR